MFRCIQLRIISSFNVSEEGKDKQHAQLMKKTYGGFVTGVLFCSVYLRTNFARKEIFQKEIEKELLLVH